jgi:hypothetical protein
VQFAIAAFSLLKRGAEGICVSAPISGAFLRLILLEGVWFIRKSVFCLKKNQVEESGILVRT